MQTTGHDDASNSKIRRLCFNNADCSYMRLQKFLSYAGFCSRRKGEKLIVKGSVKVNGKIVTELGTKVCPESDVIEVDGQLINSEKKHIYIALNKPKGYVTSCNQPGQKIIFDIINISKRVYPIGRLDKNSTGLLLLTNDGKLHHRLSHPSFDHEKEYEIKVAKPISDESLNFLEKGVSILGKITRPARIKRVSSNHFCITLKEGRNRQIRRMVNMVDNKVTNLKRIRISNIKIGKLSEGSWRYLTEKERKHLMC